MTDSDWPTRTKWSTVPAENFLAWNAFRFNEFARLIIDTHVPESPLDDPAFDGLKPVPADPVPRCGGCEDGPLWPCPLLEWALGWVEHLDEIVDAVERAISSDVSTPVVVGDARSRLSLGTRVQREGG